MRFIFYIIVFALLQALLLNHIHIFGVVTPLLYVYYALLFPRGYAKWAQMVLCFIMGISVDMFTNTPGLAAASMTFIGMLQPYFLELYLKKEDEPDFKPSLANMGFMRYLSYVFFITLIYCVIFFSLEAFTFLHWVEWLEAVFGSLLLTVTSIMIIDSTRKK